MSTPATNRSTLHALRHAASRARVDDARTVMPSRTAAQLRQQRGERDERRDLERARKRVESRRGAATVAMTALAVLALHAGIAWLAHAWNTRLPTEPARPLPMAVTLTSAPRPLPQAAPAVATPQAPPPTPQKQPVRPQARPQLQKTSAAAPLAKPAEPAAHTPPAPSTPSAPASAAAPPQAPTAPAAPTASHEPQPKETPPLGDAAYLHNPAPDYPEVAQNNGWEGRVMLRVHVLASGSPDSVAVLTSSGRRVLDEAARDTVSHWSFVPAKRGDQPVDGWVTVPINFSLGQ